MNFGTEYNRDSVETKIGNEGEELILGQLQSFLPKPFYLFKKIKTTKDSGDIDAVIITPKGIFVIECKNWVGNIYTSRDRDTATVYREPNTDEPIYYTNPVKQVEKNTYKVYKLLKGLANTKYNEMQLKENKGYFAYVIFTNRVYKIHTDLNEDINKDCGIRVRLLNNLQVNITEVYNKAKKILTRAEMKEISDYIKQNTAEYADLKYIK